MKTAIILHGMPSKESYLARGGKVAHYHWRPWLKEQLEARGIEVATPEMPIPYEPDYQTWSAVFEQFPINEETILVGHSCGGGFLVRWLSEHKIKVGKVVLVAPWVDPHGKFAPNMFKDLQIDSRIPERTAGMTMFCSTDDEPEELESFAILKEKLPTMVVKQYTDKGHFTIDDMKTTEFPDLLQAILS